ncbi:hypothetical protein K435DRAFT_795915 [Dendrothele bispora CBS 962.96]|uniref:Uncharacterized protein n=1 Tax=Dendrothele bispora (strain CBS 962.96) TaxID=1314807 RepID=A0A4S8M8J6_DENBC|nr:hypothetical protein K435DRAFT_795915 [Dendrothele bispora CBS 962.96]
MSSKRGAINTETIPIHKRRRLTPDSERTGTMRYEKHTLKLHTGVYIEPIATARKCLPPVWDDDVSMTVEDEEEDDEDDGYEDKEDDESEDKGDDQYNDKKNDMEWELREGSDAVEVEHKEIASGHPLEEVAKRTYADVAIQAGGCVNDVDVYVKTLARSDKSDKSYIELKNDIKFAERAAKVGWARYWDSEIQCLELRRSERRLVKDRAQKNRKARADEEASFWREKYAEIGRSAPRAAGWTD